MGAIQNPRRCRELSPSSERCAIVAARTHDGGRFRRWRCLQPPPLSETCAIDELANHHGASFRRWRKKTTRPGRDESTRPALRSGRTIAGGANASGGAVSSARRGFGGWVSRADDAGPNAPNPHSRRKQGCQEKRPAGWGGVGGPGRADQDWEHSGRTHTVEGNKVAAHGGDRTRPTHTTAGNRVAI